MTLFFPSNVYTAMTIISCLISTSPVSSTPSTSYFVLKRLWSSSVMVYVQALISAPFSSTHLTSTGLLLGSGLSSNSALGCTRSDCYQWRHVMAEKGMITEVGNKPPSFDSLITGPSVVVFFFKLK